MYFLGLSFNFHDAAACLVRDGEVVAAAQEERFSRIKHDARLPVQAVRFCLEQAGITIEQVEQVAFYEKPFLKFDRVVSSHLANWPFTLGTFLEMQRSWFGGKLRLASQLRKRLGSSGPILFCRHHESHAASAFFCSPFAEATIVTIDGVGEWATTAIHVGRGNAIQPVREIAFPHSLGLFYSAFTHYLGFEVNEDEYKVMGLAPYGKPVFAPLLREHFLRLNEDGSFEADERLFSHARSGRALDERRVERLLGFPRRKPGEPLLEAHQNLAASVQVLLEEAVLAICRSAIRETGIPRVCLAGGVALNCTANARLQREPGLEELYVFPASGDAGGAVGAALYGYYRVTGAERGFREFPTPYLGPEFASAEIDGYLARAGLPHRKFEGEGVCAEVARLLSEQKVVGWFQGRMEFGPRALGNRSILGDPSRKENWGRINQKVKFREDFRPLAPSVLEERMKDFFECPRPSPYMLMTARNLTDRLPAVTHVDGSSRLQTVSRAQNPRFHRLISEFDRLTGVPAVINTSFNTSGMPIVCTPQNAFQCFAESDLDVLALGDCVLRREDLPYLPRRTGA